MRVVEETRENLATPTFTKRGGYSIGITQWHPAFLALSATLDICAAVYRKFCTRYQPKPKLERKNYWGSKLLARLKLKSKPTKKKRPSPGQISLWADWLPNMDEVHAVAKKFVLANCLNPDIAAAQFPDTTYPDTT